MQIIFQLQTRMSEAYYIFQMSTPIHICSRYQVDFQNSYLDDHLQEVPSRGRLT